MTDFKQDFGVNLTAVLDSITNSVIYTDIKKMYDDGVMQKDQNNSVLINFHNEALKAAVVLAKDGYRIDEKVDTDISLKNAQKDVEIERKKLLEQQKKGFLDNRIIEFASFTTESVGMIQSGGNLAPQKLLDGMNIALEYAKKIADEHESVEVLPWPVHEEII